MPTYLYEIPLSAGGPVERGEIEATDEDDARRLLRVRFCTPALPLDTRLTDKAVLEQMAAQERSAKLRQLLRILNAHHEWLKQPDQGQRADLSGESLRGIGLARTNLSQAMLAEVDLAGADLTGADLSGANLARARLRGANLTGADLRNADLSEADLRDAILSEVQLAGADLWRANLRGCAIAPEVLHAALGCRSG